MILLLYWLALIFGILLAAYTARSLYVTKKKINPLPSSVRNSTNLWAWIKSRVALWKFYFIAGDPKNLLKNVLINAVIFLVCFYVNDFYIQLARHFFVPAYALLLIIIVWKLGKRRNRIIFETSFPEVIQILNAATSSGAGLLQAIERCGKDIQGQLGDEFKRIYRRLALGEDSDTIFDDSYSRYPYKEFYFFSTIIKINLDKGGQMKEVISRLGRVIADSKKMEQKKRAMTSEARMSAMIVAAFPFAFFIFMKFTMPENFDFVINDPNGRIILYYVLGSETFGMGIIWWLMRKVS
ncbi:tight adherence protein B [Bisgaardia hudsonensis]|uniref:Tight adherence protein B n=1 Tax=Bisgaardia hudsonensis TaxID=109472 RepID=A0A4R2MTA4_9PAST|nr:type II secretion system F family protein [Bisgaardia hudsonensis]QLB12350.1 protein dehydratase [Bisgaardia hudsonensis]TCP12399.1 tight adherence protein B [Bisgaardia hudsonensis]